MTGEIEQTKPGSSRRRAVWAAPVVVAAVVAGVAVATTTSASGSVPNLPKLSAAQLLTDLQTHTDTPLAGTVSETANLGLPSLPGAQSSASLSPQNFLTGTHTAKVWSDGPTKQRLALLGELSEADVVHNGADLWTYTSSSNTVTHITLRDHSDNSRTATLTPAQVAQRALAAVTPSTKVTVDTARMVADRPAYTLTLAPKSADSTISKITLAVDAAKYVPLQVQVFGSGSKPAFSLGYQSISFSTPAASTFQFKTPAGAKTQSNPMASGDSHHRFQHGQTVYHGRYVPMQGIPMSRAYGSQSGGVSFETGPKVVGSGWTAVADLPSRYLDGAAGGTLQKATTAVGTNGTRLLQTSLLTAVFTPDGRVFVGAVTPSYLEHVAATTH